MPSGWPENNPHMREHLKTLGVNLCRLLIALTFILSGFVKAIDPLGTQYKIDDYLEAVGLAGMLPGWLTLTTSVALSATEFTLGILLLFAIRRRLASRLALVFMVLMTAITVWLAGWNPVSDCGCFGDAVKLTNMESLLKNIVLLACAAAISAAPRRMKRFVSESNQWIVVNYTVLFILGCSIWSLWALPVFDFRPYHVGANIRKGMEIPKGAPQPQFETTFILQKKGVKKEFTLDNYPDSTWQFVDSKTRQISEGYVPPIHDFSIEHDGNDITDSIVGNKGYTFLLISPHLERADDSDFGDINQVYDYAVAEQVPNTPSAQPTPQRSRPSSAAIRDLCC